MRNLISMASRFHGGWLAPNIYFLGLAGSVIVRLGEESLRVTGASGIYKAKDYKTGGVSCSSWRYLEYFPMF